MNVPSQPARPRGTGRPVGILFCADPSYFRHLAVAAVSAATHCRSSRLDVHVMTAADPGPEGAKLAESLARFGHVRLCFYRIDGALMDNAFVDGHVTREAYFRLLAPRVLPDCIDRVIYLDCDLVVLDDIEGLAAADLGGRPVGAVPEFDWTLSKSRLPLAEGHVYVNSGVLSIDLAAWRAQGIVDEMLSCIARHGPRLRWHDQDALNVVLQGKIAHLDPRWNLPAWTYGRWVGQQFADYAAAIDDARRSPGVIHYSGSCKPWAFRSRVERKADYHRFLGQTAWRGIRPKLPHLIDRLEHELDIAFCRVGMDFYRASDVLRRLGVPLAKTPRSSNG